MSQKASGGAVSSVLPQVVALSLRETEVVHLFSLGHTTKSAARVLGLSPKTVEVYLTAGRERNECSTIAQFVGQYTVASVTGALRTIPTGAGPGLRARPTRKPLQQQETKE